MVAQMLLRKQHARLGISHHERKSFVRIFRVKRQISATCLQCPYNRDDHFERPINADPNNDIRSDAEPD